MYRRVSRATGDGARSAGDTGRRPWWDSEISYAWESACMTREDFEVVNVVQPHHAPVEA